MVMPRSPPFRELRGSIRIFDGGMLVGVLAKLQVKRATER